jgi:butyrate kinase
MLLVSIVAHIATVWYMINLLRQVKYYDEELTENITVINNFTNHLKSVYELETFYGDETLRHLLQHAQDLTSVFDQYNLYSDSDFIEEVVDDNNTRV